MNISENEKSDGLIICIDIHMQGHNNTDQIAFHVRISSRHEIVT